ncbi:MAG: GNAT family N-acetyltransferase, partial [Methylocystis silviterrae]
MAFLAHHDFDAGPRASRRACSAMSHARLEARGPFTLAEETLADVAAREALLDDAFGPARFLKTCQRLRDGSAPAPGLALVATDSVGGLIGTL